jgi:hypothetical protein
MIAEQSSTHFTGLFGGAKVVKNYKHARAAGSREQRATAAVRKTAKPLLIVNQLLRTGYEG